MTSNALQQMACRYLEKLYELSEGGLKPEVDARLVQSELGFSSDDTRPVVASLESKDLISWKCRVPCVRITTRGIDVMQQSFAEREIRVLQKLCDMSNGIPGEMIVFESLVKELGMTDAEVSGICKGLDQQDFVEWHGGDVIEITALGLHALETSRQKPRAGGDIYNTHIGIIHGAAQIGSGNVQNVQINITNNPEFDEAIVGLLQIVQASGLPNDELEELKDEVIKLNKLALSEPKADSLEKAKFRIDKAKLSFEAAKLLVQAAPHLHTAWEYLKVHFS